MIMQKKEFLKVMQLLKPGLAKKDIIEEFVHYLFTGDDVITFNDEICISHPFKTDFKCSCRAEELFKTVNGIKEETLEVGIAEAGNCIEIKSAGTRARLAVSSEDKASQLISVLNLEEVCKNMTPLPKDFVRALYLCMFSASKDMTKGIYTCVKVDSDSVYSSDGVRISKYNLEEHTDLSTLIPARNIEHLVRFPVIEFRLTDSWCHFRTEEGVVFSTRVMEGEYPSLDQYFTIEGKRVRLPSEIKSLVSSVSFMSDDKVIKDKTVTMVISSGQITCKAEKKDIGMVERDFDFEYAQEGFEIQINPIFLNEVLEKATIMRVNKNAAMFTSGTFNHIISLQ